MRMFGYWFHRKEQIDLRINEIPILCIHKKTKNGWLRVFVKYRKRKQRLKTDA